MTSPQPLARTQHRNLVTGVDLGGSTVHRESRVDIEEYLEPIAAVRTKALHGSGVATGLRVTATGWPVSQLRNRPSFVSCCQCLPSMCRTQSRPLAPGPMVRRATVDSPPILTRSG